MTSDIIKEVLNHIFNNQFGAFYYIGDKLYLEEIKKRIDIPRRFEYNGYHISIKTGCSKLTIIFEEDEKWVYKIPVSGEYYSEIGYYEKYPNNIKCEEAIYESSSLEMQEILLPNELFFIYNNIPIYVQKKINKIAGENPNYITEYIKSSTIKELETIESLYEEYSQMALIRVPKNFFKTLFLKFDFNKDLLNELSTLEDLHPFNIGYCEQEPVIFDYGGFLEEGDI